MKKFTKQEIIELYGQVTMVEISFSRMVEVLNQRLNEAEDIPEELEKGDLAIFWNDDKKLAAIRIYDDRSNESEEYFWYKDSPGFIWANAVKFESVEQFKKLLKGEI